MFGGIVVARMIDRVTWPALLYAVLSLTVIRMLPVFLCLIGTRTSTADKLFIGCFGPRGLATIVFAVLVLDEKLPGKRHDHAGGRLDRPAQCHRPWRDCKSTGGENGWACGRVTCLDG